LDLHLTAQLASSGFPILTAHDFLDSEIRCWGKAMSQPRDDRQDDLFQPSLETIMKLRDPLVRLAKEVDWDFVGRRFGSVCSVGPGQPPLSTRLVAALFHAQPL
jgi:hypothetical protein